jgi:bacterioferritin-associated ferredoxin
MRQISVELKHRDHIVLQIPDDPSRDILWQGYCCSETQALIENCKKQFGHLKNWPEPKGLSHSEMLIRELILKYHNQWSLPYKEIEICHCRGINTETVDQAIVCGAHKIEHIKTRTSASTACGTCTKDVESLISYRCHLSQSDPR